MLESTDRPAVLLQRSPHNNFLATPSYEEWRYIRKMLNPAFSPDNIRKVYSPDNIRATLLYVFLCTKHVQIYSIVSILLVF